ncbi:MAG: hypothetical protein WBG37_04635, partial [Desulfobacterales bacterium]
MILIFTALKPEGTQGADLFSRLIVWSLQVGTLLPMLIGLHIWLQSASSFNRLNPWLKLLFSGILGSLLFAPLGLVIDHLFGLEADYAVTSLWRLIVLFTDESLSILLPVTLTWVAINIPRVLRLNFAEMETSQAEGKKMEVRAIRPQHSKEILRLLPAAIGKDVVYLKSELHYLRVVTEKGETLILYNLR